MVKNTIHRIKEFIDYKGISVRLLEKSIGMSNGSFASQLKEGKTIGVDKVENFLHTYKEVNPEWLISGAGSMFKGELTNKNLVKKTEIDSKEGIPLIPISAFAGIARGEHTIMEYDCERYIVPLFKDAEFLIPVKGESMTPRYNSGDIVACKKLPLTDVFFQWNKVYVIDTDQGVLVKRIKQGSTPEQLKIISENPEYDPFELKLSQIHALAIVIGVIRLE